MNIRRPIQSSPTPAMQGPLPRGWEEGDRYIAERAWPQYLAERLPSAARFNDCGCWSCNGSGTVSRSDHSPCPRCDGTGFNARIQPTRKSKP